MTLREGLARFHRIYREHLSHEGAEVPAEAREFFLAHDVAHVLFGCDISLFGEGAVKIWTIFGTTLGFGKHLRAYRTANAFTLSQNFSAGHVVRHLAPFLIAIPVLIIRACRMRRRWPWTGYEAYLDTPIRAIRREFNIRVLGQ